MSAVPPESPAVIDMTTWPSQTVQVLELLLDEDNVRLDKANATQKEVIVDLFENEGAFELVADILKVGYLLESTPIVVATADRYKVMEGNRRVAALQAIQNPNLVPKFTTKIDSARKVSSVNWQSLDTISVSVAPNLDEANKLIAAIHTGRQRRKWNPTRQSEFFKAQLENGATLSSLVKKYPTVDVRSLVLRSRVLDLVRDATIGNEELRKFAAKKAFPVSTLERLYTNEEFREIAGLKIDTAKATARIAGGKRKWKAVAQHVVAGIKDKKLDTRILNKPDSPSTKAALKSISAAVAPKTPAAADQPSKPKAKAAQPRMPSDEHLRGAKSLVVPEDWPPSINFAIRELGVLNVRSTPNAAIDLMRSVFEKCIKAYRANKAGRSLDRVNAKALRECMALLIADLSADDPNLHQAAQRLQSHRLGEDGGGGTQLMNAANHNPYIAFTEYDAHNLWTAMMPLIQWMLKHTNATDS